MKNLLTHYSALEGSNIDHPDSFEQRRSSGLDGNEKKSILDMSAMGALANVGFTETASTRSGMMYVMAAEKQPSVLSPRKGELKRRFKDAHVEKYVEGIEQELS